MPTTEVWFRNPERYMPLLIEAGARRVVWHRGRLLKKRINPLGHARLSFPQGVDWRVLVADVRGALEYSPSSKRVTKPDACYPVWHYGEELRALEDLLAENCADLPIPFGDDPVFTPVFGQPHRVLIQGWPGLNTMPGTQFMTVLSELQRDYPDTIVHLFEAIGYRAAFSYGYGAVDLDPCVTARFGRVNLANGREESLDRLTGTYAQWVHLHGFDLERLRANTDNRIAFNIRSALWAGENFDKKIRFRVRGGGDSIPDIDSPMFGIPETGHYKSQSLLVSVLTDKVACDQCSLAPSCKYMRVGSVCNLPESETAGLAKFFKTRDSDTIIDGLSALLQVQAGRVAMGLEKESDTGELDSETSSVIKAMFEGGVKLAKLVNPALSPSGAKIAVQINQGNGAAQVSAANPKALMAALVRELEERGVPRDEITPEMVLNLVQPREVIEIENT